MTSGSHSAVAQTFRAIRRRSVCLGDDLSRIPWSIELARRTRRVIRWNLIWAFGYNSVGVACAAMGWLNPAVAAFLMVASGALVTINSLRLSRPFRGKTLRTRQRDFIRRAQLAEFIPPAPTFSDRRRIRFPECTDCRGGRAMIELPLVFLGGLLGSAHCIGMCGGFAVSIGIGSHGFRSNVRRQVIYTIGRIFTYSFFGIVAGYAGSWIAGKANLWINVQAVLCVLAGVLLIAQGLLALGLLPRRYWPKVSGNGSICLGGTFVGPFLASPRLSHVARCGGPDWLSPLRLGLWLSCAREQQCKHRAGAARHEPLWRGHRSPDDCGWHRNLVLVVRRSAKPAEDLRGLRRRDWTDIDRPGYTCSYS